MIRCASSSDQPPSDRGVNDEESEWVYRTRVCYSRLGYVEERTKVLCDHHHLDDVTAGNICSHTVAFRCRVQPTPCTAFRYKPSTRTTPTSVAHVACVPAHDSDVEFEASLIPSSSV